MSHNKMLIDATHPEETRVVVLRNGRVEEFDYESAARRLLRGSIYLAKITRVEPSLQAAFVDYGGNRHGFLAFNEIHPDYYQIPHSDRQALLDEEEADHRHDDDYGEADTGVVSDHESDHEDGHDEEDADASDAEADADDHAPDEDATAVDVAASDEDDDFDAEANAIDVTHLLPPEPAETDDAEHRPAELAEEMPKAETPAADDRPEHALEAEGEADVAASSEETAEAQDAGDPRPPKSIPAQASSDDRVVSDILFPYPPEAEGDEPEAQEAAEDAAQADAEDAGEGGQRAPRGRRPRRRRSRRRDSAAADPEADTENGEDEQVEAVGSEDALEEVPQRRRRRARSYKIQEVIKRRQIVLIQVVKEERGNKGAALTTYLSLAGRYTVLMPNTARGGGISRKITNLQDRKRLKAIAQELDVPEGMGLIIRTAGASRTKQEIKRDFEYLLRLWENVRDLTLQSTAPSLVYEEGDLIKRSIRDLYSKDIDQILVAGGEAHKEAKSFMRMLMPSHAKNVVKYEEPHPLFAKYGIESQLNAMFSPFVQLRSGGYLVINQTEALVAVDVNSGKSTKEFSIEETALNTNLEAAEELSRQLKLRDLAGLIVVDFIDMEEKRNNRAVERKLKDCLRSDRARIQVGRISHFGLLEMSRQRLRTGVLEGSTMQCPHCQGTGTIRSTESVALAVLRSLEDTLMGGQPRSLCASTAPNVALYLLNQKRHFIQDMEQRYGVILHVQASDAQQGANFSIERLQGALGADIPRRVPDSTAVSMDTGFVSDDEGASAVEDRDGGTQDDGSERKPRRRRRRRRSDEDAETESSARDEQRAERESDTPEASSQASADSEDEEAGEGRRRPRRRGRRGGRRNRDQRGTGELAADDVAAPGAPQPVIGQGQTTVAAVAVAGADADASAAQATASGAHEADAAEAMPTPEPEAQSQPIADVAPSADRAMDHDDGAVDTAGNGVAVSAAEPPPEEDLSVAADDAMVAPQQQPTDEEAVPTADLPEAAVDEHAEPAASASASNGAAGTNGAAQHEEAEPAGGGAAAPRRSRGATPVATEPRLERFVMRPDQMPSDEDAEKATAASAEKPAQKKGWWQRRFGS